MAATIVTIQSLIERLKWNTKVLPTFIEDQWIDNLDKLRHLADDKVKRTCKAIRQPGEADDDHKHKVSTLAEDNLKLAINYIKHLERTQRTMIIANIILTLTRALNPSLTPKPVYQLRREAHFPRPT